MSHNIHFWGIVGGVSAGYEKDFYPNISTHFPYEHLRLPRFIDERLLIGKLIGSGLVCRLDIIGECVSITKFRGTFDRTQRSAFTAGTYFFSKSQTESPSSSEVKVLDNSIDQCVSSQKIFSYQSLEYPSSSNMLPCFPNHASDKGLKKLKKIVIVGVSDIAYVIEFFNSIKGLHDSNTTIYFLSDNIDFSAALQDTLSLEEINTYDVFHASDDELLQKIEVLLGSNNRILSHWLKRIQLFFKNRINKNIFFFLALLFLFFSIIIFNNGMGNSDSTIHDVPSKTLHVFELDTVLSKSTLSSNDTLTFTVDINSDVYEFEDLEVFSSTHQSLRFNTIGLSHSDSITHTFMLDVVVSYLDELEPLGLVKFGLSKKDNQDTLFTSFTFDEIK